MKKFITSIAIFTLIVCYLCSCEKDDICAEGTPTTPSLIIEFYNKDNREVLKTINLEYYAEGFTDVDTIIDSRLELPLRVDADNVKWSMTYVYTPTSGNVIRNVDFLEFNYERSELYVSRACGYKTIFTLGPDTDDDSITDSPGGDGLWIEDLSVETLNIENEDETHIKIFF